jgi:hypothetical protein
MNTKSNPSPEEVALLIKKRLKTFWGYGNLDGRTWFIGMEEGLGKDEPFPLERFMSTAGKAVVDIRDNTAPDHQRWFQPKSATQPTWRVLIGLLMYRRLRSIPKLADIRTYQLLEFGLKNNDHAILELMPLPANSTSDWIYQDVPLKGLITREEYLSTYKPTRVELLKALIEKHQPKLVLFYSRSYLTDWQTIVPKPFIEVIPGKLHLVKYKGTTYAVTPHPVSRGMKTADWEEIAKHLY